MREIKFKFYSQHKESGKWSVTENTLEELEMNDSWQGVTPWIRKAVCQYTGLSDKNGVDIYEGDVLSDHPKTTNYYVRECLPFIELISVEDPEDEYDNGDFYHGSDIQAHNWYKFEVIGNIFEDSHLLDSDI